jgi:hypothetical protein
MSNHLEEFKADIISFMSSKEYLITYKNEDMTNLFIEYIKTYKRPEVELKEERNITTHTLDEDIRNDNLCIAKISQGARCSRKHKNDNVYCGTHMKRQPTGVVEETAKPSNANLTKKVDIWIQLIRGINYYIDENNNVYHPEHILSLIQNPSVIYKWKLNETNEYEIIPVD